jgi:hypothetical protein
VDEATWLSATDPAPMLEFLGNQDHLTERKSRLFAAQCCRNVRALLQCEPFLACVEAVENYADGQLSQESLKTYVDRAGDSTGTPYVAEEAGWTVGAWYAARAATGTGTAQLPLDVSLYVAWAAAATAATADLGWDEPSWVDAVRAAYLASGYDLPEQEAWADLYFDAIWEMSWDSFVNFPGWKPARIRQAVLLREFSGNPFRPVPFAPAWRSATVVALAQAAYNERDLSGHLDCTRLAVLADALEEAGCTDQKVLEHLRGPGPHFRGCFALDAVLGRE